jgi:hypothetical protein
MSTRRLHLSPALLIAAVALAATIAAFAPTPSPTLVDIGVGAKLHGPITFKNEKGEPILVLDVNGSIDVSAAR